MQPKSVLYKVVPGDDIGCIPYNSIVKGYVILENKKEALIYFPRCTEFKRLMSSKWESDENSDTGSLSYAIKKGKFYQRHKDESFFNLGDKESLKDLRSETLEKLLGISNVCPT